MKPILLLLLATLTAQAATFTGKVVGISDGDTITVLYQGNKQYKIAVALAICATESYAVQAVFSAKVGDQ